VSKIRDLITKRRVLMSWLFGLVFVLFSTPPPTVPSKTALLYLIIGLEIALLGEALRVWASGYLYKDESLAINGPFSYTRNPLYLGSFLIGFGFCFASAQPLLFIAFILFFCVVFIQTIKSEEFALEQKFSGEFAQYKGKVPVFIPSLKAYETNVLTEFSWPQVKKNKEYMAVIGVLAVALYLVIRFLIQYNTSTHVG